MVLPAWGNSLSLSQIQTEFGGSNPASLNEYYAGGANVPAGTVGYPGGVSTAIPSSGQISISNFFGASKITIVNPLTFNGSTFLDEQTATTASSRLEIQTNGRWQIWYSDGLASEGDWATPTTTNIGNSYWVRFTITGSNGYGNYDNSASTGWLQITTTRTITVNAYYPPNSARGVIYTVEISSSSGGSPVLSTSSLTLAADATGFGGA